MNLSKLWGGIVEVKWNNVSSVTLAHNASTTVYLTQVGSIDLSKYRFIGISGYQCPTNVFYVDINRIFINGSTPFVRITNSYSSDWSVNANNIEVTALYEKIG